MTPTEQEFAKGLETAFIDYCIWFEGEKVFKSLEGSFLVTCEYEIASWGIDWGTFKVVAKKWHKLI